MGVVGVGIANVTYVDNCVVYVCLAVCCVFKFSCFSFLSSTCMLLCVFFFAQFLSRIIVLTCETMLHFVALGTLSLAYHVL